MKALLVAVLIVMTAACGGTAAKPSQSPVAPVSPTAGASPSSSASGASPSGAPSPTPLVTPTGTLLVIDDFNLNQVRLARLDAFDAAVVTGHYDGVVNGQVIVVNGTTLEALSRSGSVRKLGTLAAEPSWSGPGVVAVKPDLSQWLYTVPESNWTSRVHLGTANGDRIVGTIASPDGNAFYQAYAWNAYGAYFEKQATGLGGVGPFLEYHFPLAKFEVATGRMTDITPTCYGFAVLSDGSMVCRGSYSDPQLQVRTQSGLTLTMKVTLGTTGLNAAYARVHVSPDNARVIISRDGSTDPTVNFQMVVAGLTDSAAVPFGPIDYIPDTWLPDGRLVADHWCYFDSHGACNSALDGTYIFSADGSTHTLFYRLKTGTVVNYI